MISLLDDSKIDLLNKPEVANPLWQEVLISLTLAFILGFVCSYVYQWTHRGISYSVSYVHTLMLLSPITAFVMLVIGNSVARAFSLVGALSIIRFRTPLKDTWDTTFVFLSLGIGLATGTGAYAVAILGVVAISIFTLIIHRNHLGESAKEEFLLRFRVAGSPDIESVYWNIFGKYLKKNILVNMSTTQHDNFLELAFNIIMKDPKQKQSFIQELNGIPELEQVMLVAVDGEDIY